MIPSQLPERQLLPLARRCRGGEDEKDNNNDLDIDICIDLCFF